MTVAGRRRRPPVSTSAGCTNGQRAYPQRLVLVAARLGAQRVSVFVVLHTLAVFRDGDAKNRRRVLVHPTGRLRSYRVAEVRPTTLTPSTSRDGRPPARSFICSFRSRRSSPRFIPFHSDRQSDSVPSRPSAAVRSGPRFSSRLWSRVDPGSRHRLGTRRLRCRRAFVPGRSRRLASGGRSLRYPGQAVGPTRSPVGRYGSVLPQCRGRSNTRGRSRATSSSFRVRPTVVLIHSHSK